jgi:hypothetical protein
MDRWLGRGKASITTPPLDGAFRPNDALDAAAVVLETAAPDCLAVTSLGLLVSSGRALLRVDEPTQAPAASFALADGRIVFLGGEHEEKTVKPDPQLGGVTALAPAADGALLIANGSADNAPADWKRDLMQKNASGSVWRLDPASGARTRLAGGLAFANGLLEERDSILVSESWRAALTRIAPGGRKLPALEDLPAYPGRLSRGADGAIWLALFAPRSQLVEFVLSEDGYRQRMIETVDPEFWVAPCLRTSRSPFEPLGVLKPWSPSRSYGLVARLDAALRPVASFHSRANGRRHGVTSCLTHDGRLYFAAKGDGVVAAQAYKEPTT